MAASGGHWGKAGFVSASSAMHEADRQSEIRQAARAQLTADLKQSIAEHDAANPPRRVSLFEQTHGFAPGPISKAAERIGLATQRRAAAYARSRNPLRKGVRR